MMGTESSNSSASDILPVFNHQTEMESTKISPEAWETPAERDEVISGSSLEDGSKDLELSWDGTAMADASMVASRVRSELTTMMGHPGPRALIG